MSRAREMTGFTGTCGKVRTVNASGGNGTSAIQTGKERFGAGKCWLIVVLILLWAAGANADSVRLEATSTYYYPSTGRYRNITGIKMTSPWVTGDYILVHAPEHFRGSQGNIIDQNDTNNYPSVWQVSGDGQTAWADAPIRAQDAPVPVPDDPSRTRFIGDASVEGMEVTLRLGIKENQGLQWDDYFQLLVCFRYEWMSDFADASLDRVHTLVEDSQIPLKDTTPRRPLDPGEVHARYLDVVGMPTAVDLNVQWVLTGPGRYVHEVADMSFIAVKSSVRDDRYIALFSPTGRSVFSNPGIPCLHTDPHIISCQPYGQALGDVVVIFHEGDWDSLVTRIKAMAGGNQAPEPLHGRTGGCAGGGWPLAAMFLLVLRRRTGPDSGDEDED